MNKIAKISWGVFFVLIVAALISLNVIKSRQSPEDQRAIRTPSMRLVGHWQLYSRSDLPSYELFFTAATGDERIGQVAMLDKFEDLFLLRGEYQILDEAETGTRLVIRQDLGNQAVREVSLLMARDGMSAQYSYFGGEEKFDQHMTYVDDQSTPPSIDELNDS